MTQLVPPEEIEELVGVRRHATVHYGRAVTATRTVYILHSMACLMMSPDLRFCPYSKALDRGIEGLAVWDEVPDRPVRLGVWEHRLVPVAEGTPV